MTGLTPEHMAIAAAVKAADDAFQSALVKRYGKQAGQMRYRYDLPDDLKLLALAYQVASKAWINRT